MNKNTRKSALLRIVTFCAIALIAFGGIAFAIIADQALKKRANITFEKTAAETASRLSERMENYSDLLYSGRAFLTNSNEVTQTEWDSYFKEQQVFKRYDGVSSVVFLRWLSEANRPAFLAKMRSQPFFGGASYNLRPVGVREHYAPAELSSSENNVQSSFGIDPYAEAAQKAAMDQAVTTGRPEASEPFVFGTGVPGFTMYLPVYKQGVLQGFVMTSFRTDDFIKALFGDETRDLRYKLTDITNKTEPKALYKSGNWQDKMPLERSDAMNVGGRTWQITLATTNAEGNGFLYPLVPLLVLAVGALVTIPLFGAFFIFSKRED